jgi:hypothetical protein
MIDRISPAGKPHADLAAHGRSGWPTLFCRLGVAAALAAATTLAATPPAPAQSTKAPEASSEPQKAPPRRRGISNPDAAPSPAQGPAGKASKGTDDDGVPGGLPGAQPKTQPNPGGRANPGG